MRNPVDSLLSLPNIPSLWQRRRAEAQGAGGYFENPSQAVSAISHPCPTTPLATVIKNNPKPSAPSSCLSGTLLGIVLAYKIIPQFITLMSVLCVVNMQVNNKSVCSTREALGFCPRNAKNKNKMDNKALSKTAAPQTCHTLPGNAPSPHCPLWLPLDMHG